MCSFRRIRGLRRGLERRGRGSKEGEVEGMEVGVVGGVDRGGMGLDEKI